MTNTESLVDILGTEAVSALAKNLLIAVDEIFARDMAVNAPLYAKLTPTQIEDLIIATLLAVVDSSSFTLSSTMEQYLSRADRFSTDYRGAVVSTAASRMVQYIMREADPTILDNEPNSHVSFPLIRNYITNRAKPVAEPTAAEPTTDTTAPDTNPPCTCSACRFNTILDALRAGETVSSADQYAIINEQMEALGLPHRVASDLTISPDAGVSFLDQNGFRVIFA